MSMNDGGTPHLLLPEDGQVEDCKYQYACLRDERHLLRSYLPEIATFDESLT